MKLSEYINFRNRGKINKNTNYNIRTQHFYDGSPKDILVNGSVTHTTGIKAEFMNNLSIPTASEIALEQKKEFLNIIKTKQQAKLMLELNKMNNQQDFLTADIEVQNLVRQAIKSLERGIDQVLKSATALKKAQSSSSTTNTTNQTNQLRLAYNNFLAIYNSIKNQQLKGVTDAYLQELDTMISSLEGQVVTNPSVLIDPSLFSNKRGESRSFIQRLGYLSKQIKGITLLEHRGIEFIKKIPLPENITFVGSGQILVSGEQASQDALFFDKNLEITLTNGTKIKLYDYLNNSHEITETISFTDSEWEQVMRSAIGLQSKYHRGGYIAMGKVNFYDVINTDYAQAKALRNLYILSQGTQGYGGENVARYFHVKKQHSHYKALFSYCLGKFLNNKIIKGNYYMMTARGIMDSYNYYVDLFSRSRYFAPIGDVSVTIPKEYRIAIKET